jgi:hypothetical protein
MALRLIPAFALAAAIVYACGPRSHSSEAPERSRSVSGPSIVTTLDVRQRGHQLAFTLRVTNNAKKKLELVFPSGQTHEVVVFDAVGEEVWRWSDGRMFTQALQNRVLAAGDTLTLEMIWTPKEASSGSTMTAVATLLSDNHPLEQRTDFVIP